MSSQLNNQTYYEILEISPQATEHEIIEAYRKAKRTYSPDSPALYTMFTNEEARDLLNLIEEAYSTLNNLKKRHEYDKSLQNIKPFAEPLEDDELPDLEPAEKVPYASRQASAAIQFNDEVPSGFLKSKYSIYKVNEAFEEDIKNQVVCDGPFLQKVRLYKNINIEQISEDIRVSKSYLIAVETNDYTALPNAVFVRGFVVQLAKCIGLDEKKVANSYMQALKNARGS